jgi:hypothetical protein
VQRPGGCRPVLGERCHGSGRTAGPQRRSRRRRAARWGSSSHNGTSWFDELGHDWGSVVRFSLPDQDIRHRRQCESTGPGRVFRPRGHHHHSTWR